MVDVDALWHVEVVYGFHGYCDICYALVNLLLCAWKQLVRVHDAISTKVRFKERFTISANEASEPFAAVEDAYFAP